MTGARGRELLVVGGGIGFAPLRPAVLEGLADEGIDRVAVAVGARTPEQIIFGGDLEWWASTGAAVEVVVDVASPGWTGEVGVVTDVLRRIMGDAARTVALVCGPEIMIRVVARHLTDQGVAPTDIHVSVERNMHCGIGHCGHCQLGPLVTCLDGPVVPWSIAGPLLEVRRL